MARGTRAALTLGDLEATPGAPEAGAAGKKDSRRGMTLRLEPEAWRQLKMLGIEQGKPVHHLLVDAVNLLFHHHNRPTIAG
jgi:hypothetical protein